MIYFSTFIIYLLFSILTFIILFFIKKTLYRKKITAWRVCFVFIFWTLILSAHFIICANGVVPFIDATSQYIKYNDLVRWTALAVAFIHGFVYANR